MTSLFIKKLITPFLLPPGIFILLLFLAALFFFIRKRFRPAFVSLFLCLVIWIFSIVPTADFLARGLESGYSIPDKPRADVIVLLGGGVIEDVQDISGTGAPLLELNTRIIAAVRLHRMLGTPIIISGGKVFNNHPETVVVKRFLTDLGVAPSKIYSESESNDTLENALNTKIVLDKYGFKKPLILTTAMHMRRAELSFRLAGINAKPYPVGFKTFENRKYRWHSFLPDAGNMHNISKAIHEYIGYWFYKIVY